MIISRIKLRNWKNFSDVEASLGDRVFIIGPNASGKSNLLDAFRFLRDIAGENLRGAVAHRDGVSAMRCLFAHGYSNIDVEVDLADEDGQRWTYRLVFNQDNNQRPSVREESVWHENQRILVRPDADDNADPVRLTQTALEQISANQPFREVAEFFSTISYQHLLPQVVRDPAGFSPVPMHNDPFGRDFLMRLWRTSERTRQARLKIISRAMAIAVPQLADFSVEMDRSGSPHLIGGFKNWRPRPARQNEGQLSDGTLRLLGMLWATYEGNGPLLIEEPELSLHPEVVRVLPQVFHRINRERKRRRQIIIATHSEELLSDPGIAAEEVLRLEPSSEGTRFVSADASDREAMQAGLTAAEVLLPKAAPPNASQLALQFG